MPREVVSEKVSAGSFIRRAVLFQVTRNALTVLAPNTWVSPKANDCARARLIGPDRIRGRQGIVRGLDCVGSRNSKVCMYRANSE